MWCSLPWALGADFSSRVENLAIPKTILTFIGFGGSLKGNNTKGWFWCHHERPDLGVLGIISVLLVSLVLFWGKGGRGMGWNDRLELVLQSPMAWKVFYGRWVTPATVCCFIRVNNNSFFLLSHPFCCVQQRGRWGCFITWTKLMMGLNLSHPFNENSVWTSFTPGPLLQSGTSLEWLNLHCPIPAGNVKH